MAQKVDLKDAQLNLSFCIDGQVYLVAMEMDDLKAVELLVKTATGNLFKTNRSQQELLKFLGLEE